MDDIIGKELNKYYEGWEIGLFHNRKDIYKNVPKQIMEITKARFELFKKINKEQTFLMEFIFKEDNWDYEKEENLIEK